MTYLKENGNGKLIFLELKTREVLESSHLTKVSFVKTDLTVKGKHKEMYENITSALADVNEYEINKIEYIVNNGQER